MPWSFRGSKKIHMLKKKRLVVIGGGAAGFFCAINAARLAPELEVIILEKTGKLLSKVKVSGGGRCNVTHACFSISEMIKKYPRGSNFLKKSFHHFFTSDTIKWFEERGVRLKTEIDGRMFPISDDSQTIIDCLLNEADKYNVKIMLHQEVRSLKRVNENWELHLANGEVMDAGYLSIASGGYNTAARFSWITQHGHTIEEPVPSLFTFNMPGNSISALMGITIENVKVKINGTKLVQDGSLLITHWCMSGPAILKLSALAARYLHQVNYNFTISVSWLPGFNEQSLTEKFKQYRLQLAAQKFSNRNPFQLPQRLWDYFIHEAGIKADIRWADLPVKEQNKLIRILCVQQFQVMGKTTFKEEFVTAGGITLGEIDANTFKSRIMPNVYFAGEVLDVDGLTGGFNFQSAWTGGFVSGKDIAEQEYQI